MWNKSSPKTLIRPIFLPRFSGRHRLFPLTEDGFSAAAEKPENRLPTSAVTRRSASRVHPSFFLRCTADRGGNHVFSPGAADGRLFYIEKRRAIPNASENFPPKNDGRRCWESPAVLRLDSAAFSLANAKRLVCSSRFWRKIAMDSCVLECGWMFSGKGWWDPSRAD